MSAELARLVAVVAEMSRSFDPYADAARTLDMIVGGAVDAIPGVHRALITMSGGPGGRTALTVASAGSRSAADTVGDDGSGTASHRAVSIDCLPGCHATLDLYSQGARPEGDDLLVDLFASQTAVMMRAMNVAGRLEAALRTCQVIGQASGILMERDSMGADQAFATLVGISQSRNVKVRDVAADLVAGNLSDATRPRHRGR